MYINKIYAFYDVFVHFYNCYNCYPDLYFNNSKVMLYLTVVGAWQRIIFGTIVLRKTMLNFNRTVSY